jgi:nucleoside-diphosphate-sugar epimerase
MMTTALITGGLGLIGSFITRRLIQKDVVDTVVCLDHFGRYTSSVSPTFTDYRKLRLEGVNEQVIIERGETSHFTVVNNILEEYRPDYIFHLAALPLAKLNNLNAEEARAGSVDSTGILLEILGHMRRRGGYAPKRFVYASSSMIYGDFVEDPATEEHPTRPKEIYGTMKLAGEVITRGLGGFYDIPYAIVRPSAIYGPTDMNQRVSQIFLEKAFLGQPITVHGADEALDFTYVKDVANGFVLTATQEGAVGETFNITHGKAHTLLDYVAALRQHFPELNYEVVERDAFRPKRGTLSIDKARRLLGYAPAYTLQQGVDEYVDFVRKHNPLLANPAG